ncbi:MAG: hypothetical protein AAFQ51_12650, partial [Pseudomonadota bacterium]
MTVTVRHVASFYDTDETALALASAVALVPSSGVHVLAGGMAEGGLSLLGLGADLSHIATVEDPALAGLTALVPDGLTYRATARFADGVATVGLTGTTISVAPGAGAPVAALDIFRIAETTWTVSSPGSGLTITGNGTSMTVPDTPTLPLGDVTAVAGLRTAERSVVLAASAFDAGLASFVLLDDGTVDLNEVVWSGGTFPVSRITAIE